MELVTASAQLFTRQNISVWLDNNCSEPVAKESSFSLHAGITAHAWEQ
jgi:hypothetical protein